MITLLEFICEKLMGPPTSRKGTGESTWDCPECGHSRWHTLPHLPPNKDRFRCWSCQFGGDVYDLLLHFFPSEFFPGRQAMVAHYQEEYQRWLKADEPAEPEPEAEATPEPEPTHEPTTFLLRGFGDFRPTREDNWAASNAWADLTPWERDTLINAQSIIRAKAPGISFDLLADHCRDFAEWAARTDAEHLTECDEPDCDAVVCRAARGLHPLTAREIREQTAEQERQRLAYRARVMEQIRNAPPRWRVAKKVAR